MVDVRGTPTPENDLTDLGRLPSWLLRYCIPENSSWQAPLQYLLDHPRRCYIYLFPRMQTWILFVVVLILTYVDTTGTEPSVLTILPFSSIDWICFLVLDIGDPIIESIPVGTRISIGLLQACAVRAAGFVTVSIAGLAPAVKYVIPQVISLSLRNNRVLYVVMMYISVYPIAMSVRNTNVYEEQSLGLFSEDDVVDAEQGVELENKLNSGRHVRGALSRSHGFDVYLTLSRSGANTSLITLGSSLHSICGGFPVQ